MGRYRLRLGFRTRRGHWRRWPGHRTGTRHRGWVQLLGPPPVPQGSEASVAVDAALLRHPAGPLDLGFLPGLPCVLVQTAGPGRAHLLKEACGHSKYRGCRFWVVMYIRPTALATSYHSQTLGTCKLCMGRVNKDAGLDRTQPYAHLYGMGILALPGTSTQRGTQS